MKEIRGFSLIELMVVVAIVAIIASIAYPSYQEQMSKTRRSDGKAALMDAAAKMERYYTQFGRYTATIADAGILATSPKQYYLIAPGTVVSQTFILRATRQGAQATDKCGNLDINQAQVQGATGGSLNATQCW